MQRRSQEFPVPGMHRLDGPLVAGWVVGFVLSGEIIREAVGSPDPHSLDRGCHIRDPEPHCLAHFEIWDQAGLNRPIPSNATHPSSFGFSSSSGGLDVCSNPQPI